MLKTNRDVLTKSERIHEQLSHPVIDGDGHWLESLPILTEYLRDIAGPRIVDEFLKRNAGGFSSWYQMSASERQSKRVMRPPWWGLPARDALERATVTLPALLYDRLESFGIDFAVLYPTAGLYAPTMPGSDLRRAVCRAHNTMSAEMFADYTDRMTPVAMIPSCTPEEAIDELEFVVNDLHLKAALISGSVRRQISAYGTESEADPRVATYIDNLVLDSDFDYDPLWRRFCDLGVAVTTHSGSKGWMDRRSPTNHMFNHLGHFAQSNHNFARALILSGVTYRFPQLNFAFLEGGVGWACNLLSDMIGHWHTRARDQIIKNLRPSNIDQGELRRLFEEYGGRWSAGRIDEQMRYLYANFGGLDLDEVTLQEVTAEGEEFFDEFAAAHILNAEDIREQFTSTFFFGCEADDPMTALAFDSRFEQGIKPILGSDIAHFDVPDMTLVLAEAYELVEHGLLTEQDFKAFTFDNIVELHGKMNSDFFGGTIVEDAVVAHFAQSGRSKT